MIWILLALVCLSVLVYLRLLNHESAKDQSVRYARIQQACSESVEWPVVGQFEIVLSVFSHGAMR